MDGREQKSERSRDDNYLADRLELLNEHLISSLPIAFLCCTIILFNLLNVVSLKLLLGWYIASGLIFVVRYFIIRYYHAHLDRTKLNLKLFIFGSILTAIMWGIAGTLLMPPGYYLQQTVVMVIVAGVVSGGLQSLQPSRLASSIYVLISIVPLTIWLFAQGEKNYYFLCVAFVLYTVFMLITTKRGYDIILSSLELSYENADINLKLEEANQLLKKDINVHKKNEKALGHLASIVEFSQESIIGMDIDGVIQFWNKAAEQLYGYKAQEIIGKPISILTPKQNLDELNVMLKKALVHTSFKNIETKRVNKNGEHIPVEITISPIENQRGIIIGISSIDRNIAERIEINKIKNDFISLVGHELYTPLTSIKDAIGILLDKSQSMPATQIEHLLEVAHNNCDRLIRLINNILDMEKIESGKLDFKFNRINLSQIIQRAIDENKAYADKFQVQLVFNNKIDAYVNGDHDRLIQVMTNLISNAVKFSPQHANVDIDMQKEDDHVRVSITDYGQGIPEKFKEKIFEKLTQADSSNSSNGDGTGLGLNICKLILERHDSYINFKSQEGKGSTFYFVMPLVPQSELSDSSSSETSP